MDHFSCQGLPRVPGIELGEKKERLYGHKGYDRGKAEFGAFFDISIIHHFTGWGSSARQKLYFGPLGYEAGSSPIQRKTSFERSYNYGLRTERQFPPLSLAKLQLMIDTGRLDTEAPIDMATLSGTKLVRINPNKNQFGFNLVSEGMDNFTAKINIEVQWASEQ